MGVDGIPLSPGFSVDSVDSIAPADWSASDPVCNGERPATGCPTPAAYSGKFHSHNSHHSLGIRSGLGCVLDIFFFQRSPGSRSAFPTVTWAVFLRSWLSSCSDLRLWVALFPI